MLLATAALDPDLAALRAADQRLADVAFRLQTANVALCPDVRALPGFTVQTAAQFNRGDRDRVRVQLGLGPYPGVGVVAQASQAARAGIRVGDVLVAINGTPAPAESPTRYAQAAATERLLDEAFAAPPVQLKLADRTVTLPGDRGCASRAQIVSGGLGATAADGDYVQISQAMFDLAANDDALAVVTAHELAHNILRHAAKRTKSKQAEYEADALSVKLVARAGYNLDAILPFWEAVRKRTDYGVFADGTHPGWRKRIAALAAAVAAEKLAASQAQKAR